MEPVFLVILSVVCSAANALPLGGFTASTAILTPFNTLGDATNQKIGQLLKSATVYVVPPFPDSGRKKAVLETETLLSKSDTAYSNLQQFVAGFYGPKPIVDTISEGDKYGNYGEKSRAASTALIGAYEGLSNVLNAAVEVPFQAASQVSKKISGTLDMVGGKLVGLS